MYKRPTNNTLIFLEDLPGNKYLIDSTLLSMTLCILKSISNDSVHPLNAINQQNRDRNSIS